MGFPSVIPYKPKGQSPCQGESCGYDYAVAWCLVNEEYLIDGMLEGLRRLLESDIAATVAEGGTHASYAFR
jgi:hypothetical protein